MIPGGEGKWVKICFNSLTNLPSWGKSIEEEEGPGSSSHTWHASPASQRRAHCWCAFKGKPSRWSCRPAAAEWLKLGEYVKALHQCSKWSIGARSKARPIVWLETREKATYGDQPPFNFPDSASRCSGSLAYGNRVFPKEKSNTEPASSTQVFPLLIFTQTANRTVILRHANTLKYDTTIKIPSQ